MEHLLKDCELLLIFSLSSVRTTFENYGTYSFDDPARKMNIYPYQVLDKTLDQNGEQVISIKKK